MVMSLSGRWIASAALAFSLLPMQGAWGQTGRELDRLIIASADQIQPMQTADTDTRASQRLAIVVANEDYDVAPDLPNAGADAELVAQFLTTQGYDVLRFSDASKRDFEEILRRAISQMHGDTEVVFFYAGHGFQVGTENYLLPTDASLDNVYDLPFEAVALSSVMDILEARARLQVFIVDAFRETSFVEGEFVQGLEGQVRASSSSFAVQVAPPNSLMIFSTSPGLVAFDGEDGHSPFTSTLLFEASAQPDAVIREMMEQVRQEVMALTADQQVPWHSSTLVEPARFGLDSHLSRPTMDSGSFGGFTDVAQNTYGRPSGSSSFLPAADELPVLDINLEDQIALGASLADLLGVAVGDIVTITEDPELGRLVLIDDDGLRTSAVGRVLNRGQLERVVFVAHGMQIRAETVSPEGISDVLSVNLTGVEQPLAINWIPNACDFEAGDHLDPGGVGLARYANEMRPELALAACEAAVTTFPNEGRYHYQLGRALRALGRLDDALASFETARELGHVRAWVAIGNIRHDLYRQASGDASGQAPDGVLMYYARGVDLGDPYAFHALGKQLLRFGETPEARAEGFDLELQALEVGHTFALNELGYYFLNENSEHYDAERGLRYLRESAARDDIYGFNNMGLVFRDGLGGTEPDPAAAVEMFRLASDGGHPTAPANLGRMLYRGEAPGGKDVDQAMELLMIGLDRGQAYAGVYAGFILSREDSVAGYTPFHRGAILARTAVLNDSSSARDAAEKVSELSESRVAGATEVLMADLGLSVAIDGSLSGSELSALENFLQTNGVAPGGLSPADRLNAVARLTWELSPYRRDLY